MDSVAGLLREAQLLGFAITLVAGKLEVQGPRTEAGMLERLRDNRDGIVAYLTEREPYSFVRYVDNKPPLRQKYLQFEDEALRAWLREG